MFKEIIIIRRTSLKSSAMGFSLKPEFILAYLSAINYHPVLVKPLQFEGLYTQFWIRPKQQKSYTLRNCE